jgi:hypothetical protein
MFTDVTFRNFKYFSTKIVLLKLGKQGYNYDVVANNGQQIEQRNLYLH